MSQRTSEGISCKDIKGLVGRSLKKQECSINCGTALINELYSLKGYTSICHGYAMNTKITVDTKQQEEAKQRSTELFFSPLT